jgi:hypothetical protein
VTCTVTWWFGLVFGFIELLQNVTTCNCSTVAKAECTLARCGRRYNKRYDTRCETNATCIARKHRKRTEAAKQMHTGTIATRQRHLSVSYHSRGHGVLVFYDQCRSTSSKRNMTGTQEVISSMILFIKLVCVLILQLCTNHFHQKPKTVWDHPTEFMKFFSCWDSFLEVCWCTVSLYSHFFSNIWRIQKIWSVVDLLRRNPHWWSSIISSLNTLFYNTFRLRSSSFEGT